MEAATLIADVHGRMLRLVSDRTGLHHQGLRVAANYAKRHGMIDNRLQKRLINVDIAYHVSRHITMAACAKDLSLLKAALSSASSRSAHPDDGVEQQSGAPDPAAKEEEENALYSGVEVRAGPSRSEDVDSGAQPMVAPADLGSGPHPMATPDSASDCIAQKPMLAPDPEENAPNRSGAAGLCGSSHCSTHVVPPDPLADHEEANVLNPSGAEDLCGSFLSDEDSDELAQKAYRCHMKRIRRLSKDAGLECCEGRGKGRQRAAPIIPSSMKGPVSVSS